MSQPTIIAAAEGILLDNLRISRSHFIGRKPLPEEGEWFAT